MPGQFATVLELVKAANEVREQVVRTLSQYLELAARMRDFEDLFSAQVLHSEQQFLEITRNRRRLEAERDRIRARLEAGRYNTLEEIEDDVRDALAGNWAGNEEAAAAVDDGLDETADGAELDSATKQRILRDFKRIVLPAVHADTSDASFSPTPATWSCAASGGTGSTMSGPR